MALSSIKKFIPPALFRSEIAFFIDSWPLFVARHSMLVLRRTRVVSEVTVFIAGSEYPDKTAIIGRFCEGGTANLRLQILACRFLTMVSFDFAQGWCMVYVTDIYPLPAGWWSSRATSTVLRALPRPIVKRQFFK